MAKHELAWTNITRDALRPQAQEAWDLFMVAKQDLEKALAEQAITDGAANEGDAFKFAYRAIGQGSIGMAIDAPAKSQASGFGGLKRPVDSREQEATNLARYLEERRNSGRRF